MLRFMRDYATSWMIKFILGAIVVVFVFWGVGSFRSQKANQVATVNGEVISIEEYREAYNNLIEQMRQQFGNNLDNDMLKMLQVEKQALDRLINRKLLLQEAQRLNIQVAEQELAEAITAIPAFQVAGTFDKSQYQRVLGRYRLTPEVFEAQQKQTMLMEKLSRFVFNGVKVSESEALDWYNWQNATVDLDFVLFEPGRQALVEADTDALAAYFEKNQESYKTEPQRKARYLFFDPAVYAPQVALSREEMQDYYNARPNEFETPQTVEARHILIKVNEDASPEQAEAALQKAADVYAKAMAGEDFAELAKTYSEGPTKDRGGYLGAFERDRMVKPFADKAFAMAPGEISEPVRTRFGWHVIKVEKVNPASTATFAEAEPRIRKQLTEQKAKIRAYDAAEKLLDAVYEGDDLSRVAEAQGLSLMTTSFFSRAAGPAQGIKNKTQFAAAAFELAEMDVSEIQDFGDGYYIIQVLESIPARIPKLDEVQEQVRKDYVKAQQEEKALQAAEELLDALKKGAALEDEALKRELPVKTTGPFKRSGSIPQIGYEREISEQAFQLTATANLGDKVYKAKKGYIVMRLRERIKPDAAGFANEKENIKRTLLQQKQNRTFNAWLEQIKAKSEILVTKEFGN